MAHQSPLPQPVTSPISVFLPKSLKSSSFNTPQNKVLPDHELSCLRWWELNSPEPYEENCVYRRIGCMNNNNSLLHAISKGLSSLYQESYFNTLEVIEDTLCKFEKGVNDEISFSDDIFDKPRCTKSTGSTGDNQTTSYQIKNKQKFEQCMKEFRFHFVLLLRCDLINKIKQDSNFKELVLKKLNASLEEEVQNLTYHFGLLPERAFNLASQNLISKYIKELESEKPIQPEFINLLSDYFDVDIYLIRDLDSIMFESKKSLFYCPDLLNPTIIGPKNLRTEKCKSRDFLPDRKSLIMIMMVNEIDDSIRYELIVRIEENRTHHGYIERKIYPLLDSNEPIVEKLYLTLKDL